MRKISFYLFISILICISCKLPKAERDAPVLDTIVDYTKVDSSPYFKTCRKYNNKERTACFQNIIQKKLSSCLNKFMKDKLVVLDCNFIVAIEVNRDGKFRYLSIESKELDEINLKLPTIEKSLKMYIKKFPKAYPAIKRGIPVKTQYKLPIHLKRE